MRVHDTPACAGMRTGTSERMEIYLVGGAVRDRLLDLPVAERDWVVVGATPEEMLAQGYTRLAGTFRSSCTPTARKNMHWHAPSARPVTATPALTSAPTRM